MLAALAGAAAVPSAQAAAPIPAPTLAFCRSEALTGLTGHGVSAQELAAHRKQAVPSIHYSFGSHPEGGWGLFLTLKVNEAGKPVCYQAKDQYGTDIPLNAERRAVLEQVKDWQYAPFMQDQHPVAAVLVEHIGEEELPQRHLATPEGPAQSVRLRLDRGGCSGGCPVYSVEISGDGHVVYRGADFVDVMGEHHYSVPAEDVAALVQKLRAADLWSLRDEYVFYIEGAPPYGLSMRIGSARRDLLDYAGELAGMPQAVIDFENELDRVARTPMWIALTAPGVEQLKQEGFDFHSRSAGALLARAAAAQGDEAALLELVSLGAPLTSPVEPEERLPDEQSLTVLDEALLNGQGALVDALLSRGVLSHGGGRVDSHRLDIAFRAAIIGGQLAQVQKIWDAGDGRHPSLTYVEFPRMGHGPAMTLPVSLLLSPQRGQVGSPGGNKERGQERDNPKPWEGLAIVKFLEAHGCDIKASTSDGINLLHVAVAASDVDMVSYLLSHGLKDTTAARGAPLLQNAHDEQTALLLLTSGTSHPLPGEAGKQYRTYIESQQWTRVAAWLTSHKE